VGATVYFIRCKTTPYVKIGRTGPCPERRIYELQTGCPLELSLEYEVSFPTRREADEYERFLHDFFGDRRVRGEWFEIKDLETLLVELRHASIDG
jgi:hypothetical protein